MISISLCTYNGGRYLLEQLGSIENQNRLPDELVVCDDRSNDTTLEILSEFRARAPFSVHIHRNDSNLGPVQNFEKAISLCAGDYIFLCDQDDVWLPNKIETSMQKILQMEATYGKTTPILVHADAKVVDANLAIIAESLWEYQKGNPANGTVLNRLLLQNPATGCTVAINAVLRKIALPIAKDAMMHDWWLTMVAAAFGKVGYIENQLLLYRQHGKNDTGAKKWGIFFALSQLCNVKHRRELLKANEVVTSRIENQCHAFLLRYSGTLTKQQSLLLKIFTEYRCYPVYLRKYYMLKYRIFYHDFFRTFVRFFLR